MNTATRSQADLAMEASFYASGRRDGNILRYHSLDPQLFAMSATRAQKLAEANGRTNWTVERFFQDYAKQFVE